MSGTVVFISPSVFYQLFSSEYPELAGADMLLVLHWIVTAPETDCDLKL